MRLSHYFLIVSFLTLAACSTIRVANDYDPGYDYSKLKSFNWIPNPNAKQRSELVAKHFKNAMERQLSTKGIVLDEENPDFRIAYHGNVERRVQVTNWGYRYPGWYGGGGGLDVYQYKEGTIVIDFIDAKSNEMIYRSSLSAEVDMYQDSQKRMERIEEAVTKIMEDFPPKTKGR
jgi:hypothetical protein